MARNIMNKSLTTKQDNDFHNENTAKAKYYLDFLGKKYTAKKNMIKRRSSPKHEIRNHKYLLHHMKISNILYLYCLF